jgi:hypothetical protein
LKLLNLLAALALLSVAPALAAQSAWLENGKSAPKDPSRASDGTFGAMLVLTDDWDDFTKHWDHPSAGFAVPEVSSIEKGHPLMSAIIFTGCRADQTGNCSVTGDFQVIDPNGKSYADQRGVSIWNLPPPPDRHLQLSAGALGLSLDPPDPLGTYTVVAHVTDRVSNKTLELRTTFQAN